MREVELPAGQAVEIEFIRETKPNQRGILPDEFHDDPRERAGFWFCEVKVPENLGFGEDFRLEVARKWLNLATVAEIKHLPDGALTAEIDRLRELHEQVQKRLRSP